MSGNGNGHKKFVPFFGCLMTTKHSQFEAAVRRTMPKLGVELVDIDGFSCCPDPIYYKASDKLDWVTLAARNICLAEEAGLDMLTCCSGCTSTLREANHMLQHDDELRGKVNERLKTIGREYKGSIRVRNIAAIVRDDIGFDAVKESVTRPLEGFRVAIHYGCHLLKPQTVMEVDDPGQPEILQNLIKATGAEPVWLTRHLVCCGKASQSEGMRAAIMNENLTEFHELDVDAIGLVCPTCFDEYDLGQLQVGRKYEKKFKLPVLYYFQLLALAQGYAPDDVGLKRHKISVKPALEKLGLN
jgi:heterodisulfide reductase subunit B